MYNIYKYTDTYIYIYTCEYLLFNFSEHVYLTESYVKSCVDMYMYTWIIHLCKIIARNPKQQYLSPVA
jgi:hypothetical protein